MALEILAKKAAGMNLEEFQQFLGSHDDSDGEESDAKPKSRADYDKTISRVVDAALKSHVDKQVAIKAFRQNLGLLVTELETKVSIQMPIFIFVDELDRCRPTYAIELLEGIKHLFGVRGIYFVIGVNLTQLGHSTRALYGPEFEGQTYLKRFFDLDYALPLPRFEAFAKYLFLSPSLSAANFGNSQLPAYYIDVKDRSSNPSATRVFAMYSELFALSLRDQQQIALLLEAICASSTLTGKSIQLHYLVPLLAIRHKDAQRFERIMQIDNKAEFLEAITLLAQGRTASIFLEDEGPSILLSNVANIFHIASRLSSRDLIRKFASTNVFKFPEGLLSKFAIDDGQNQRPDLLSSLALYPDLVRTAGQMIKL